MWSSNPLVCKKSVILGIFDTYAQITHCTLEYPYLNAENLNSSWGIVNCPVALENHSLSKENKTCYLSLKTDVMTTI